MKLKGTIRNSRDAFYYFRDIAEESQEVMWTIFLTVRNEVLNKKEIFRGTIEGSIASPREILKAALENNAARIIVGHNHPSRRCEPSDEDIDFTAKLAFSAEVMGIPLLDHLIVGDAERYYSFADSSASPLSGPGRRLSRTYRSRLLAHPSQCSKSSSSHRTASRR